MSRASETHGHDFDDYDEEASAEVKKLLRLWALHTKVPKVGG